MVFCSICQKFCTKRMMNIKTVNIKSSLNWNERPLYANIKKIAKVIS